MRTISERGGYERVKAAATVEAPELGASEGRGVRRAPMAGTQSIKSGLLSRMRPMDANICDGGGEGAKFKIKSKQGYHLI
jgi:hypothetical protein